MLNQEINLSPSAHGLPQDWRPDLSISLQDEQGSWSSLSLEQQNQLSSAEAVDSYVQEKNAKATSMTIWMRNDDALRQQQIKSWFQHAVAFLGFQGDIRPSKAKDADGNVVPVLRVRKDPVSNAFIDMLTGN